jgi:hypothetical protein
MAVTNSLPPALPSEPAFVDRYVDIFLYYALYFLAIIGRSRQGKGCH